MSVLVFAESLTGKIKKSALEALSYGYQIAQQNGTTCVALTIGKAEGADTLGQYGADKVLEVANVNGFDSQVYSSIVSQVAQQVGATLVVFAHSSTGKSIAGRVAVRLNAGLVSAVTSLLVADKVSKNVFSGKGIATYSINTEIKIVTISANTFPPKQIRESAIPVEAAANINIPISKVKVVQTSTVEGIVPLPEADLVVSAGRGMKAPENWGIVEDLATVLGATTACSRPVADIHWRPHHEHVGQTGVAIKPSLYIAIGISGAIQHLAGVNQSKTIVVINKDPEAPFFKAADYGIVGDLFDIVPKLTAALKHFKAQN
jgi:electron transfer flavoprotein alpha subunit